MQRIRPKSDRLNARLSVLTLTDFIDSETWQMCDKKTHLGYHSSTREMVTLTRRSNVSFPVWQSMYLRWQDVVLPYYAPKNERNFCKLSRHNILEIIRHERWTDIYLPHLQSLIVYEHWVVLRTPPHHPPIVRLVGRHDVLVVACFLRDDR